ncbi:MAG: hypothetical protein ACE37H_11490 [Phycisphaeraceae bacterium]
MPDRLTQLIALVLLAGGLVAAFMMTPAINQQRVDRQLTYDVEVGDSANPAYAFGEALGSFRGLFINVLWQRAEKLKQEGKYFEANNLAEMITTLQPRYPEAWNFHGWNMAYNISVKCKTKEERWDWVQKGMALIRDRGIPNNPNGVVLYRSLAWILGHKMAGQTDDMHYYYKLKWAENWQTLLGEPAPGGQLKPRYTGENEPTPDTFDPLEHVEWNTTRRMRSISAMADRYFLRPGAAALGKNSVAATDALGNTIDRDYNASNYFSTLSPDTRDRFFADHPDLRTVVRELEQLKGEDGQALGLGLNVKTLRAFGRIMMYRDAGYWIDNPAVISPETVGVEGVAVKQWMDQRQQNDVLVMVPFVDVDKLRERVAEQSPDAKVIDLLPMLDLLRAQALIADYHMDPAYMLYCMERFGPLEWRHPSAHAVYWTALGTLRAQGQINRDRVDFINANRATFHALQELTQRGKLSFRPEVEALGIFGRPRIHTASDTRMIPAYERAVTDTTQLIEDGVFGDHDATTYERGHENFLQSAVVLYYFEGNDLMARQTFERAKKQYANKGAVGSAVDEDGEYNLGLGDFVRTRLEDELGFQYEAYITSLIDQGWREVIVARDPAVMQRKLVMAKSLYDQYLEDRDTGAKNDVSLDRGRQSLPPFDELIQLGFLNVVRDPGYTLPQKEIIWRRGASMLASVESERPVALIAYREMVGFLNQQAEIEGFGGDLRAMFPEPPGYRDWLQTQDNAQPPRPAPVRPGF